MDDGGGERAMMGYSMSTCSRQVVRTTALRSRKRETERGRKREFLVLYSVLISKPGSYLCRHSREDPEKKRPIRTPHNAEKFQVISFLPIPLNVEGKSPNLVKLIPTHAIETQEHPIRVSSSTCTSYLSLRFFLQATTKAREVLKPHILHPAQTPLNILTTKNQQAPINLIPLRTATLYNTTPM
jgi:hypothetical protein